MSSRWPLVLAALCVALSVFCASQWIRESELRAELLTVRVAERDLRAKSAEALRLGETYAAEIRRQDTRVGELKRSEEAVRKELAVSAAGLAAARQIVAELTPLRGIVAQQNESIRRQNAVVAKQNDAIRAQNENLRKLIEERDAVVRLLNERTEIINKLTAEKAAK
jgi:hypothetical protein